MNPPSPHSAPPQAIVLAAGKGTRMNSDLPKVLFEACGRPLVVWVLDALRAAGTGRILVVVGYQADRVQAALADYPDIQFVVQTEQLGTGHAVMTCADRIRDFSGPLLVVTGDSPMLQTPSLQALLDAYRPGQTAGLLGTLMHDQPAGLGRIIRDSEGRFTGIIEDKDCSAEQRAIHEVNMSTYLFDCQELLRCLPRLGRANRQGEYYITDVPGIMLGQGLTVEALPVLQPCESLSVNTPAQLADVEQEMRRLSMAP